MGKTRSACASKRGIGAGRLDIPRVLRVQWSRFRLPGFNDAQFGRWSPPSVPPAGLLLRLQAHFATAHELSLQLGRPSAACAPFRRAPHRVRPKSFSADDSTCPFQDETFPWDSPLAGVTILFQGLMGPCAPIREESAEDGRGRQNPKAAGKG